MYPKDTGPCTLGEAKFDSPLKTKLFVEDDDLILLDINAKTYKNVTNFDDFPKLEKAGPRKKVFFQPKYVSVGIVTCGGICPGINAVIYSLVMELHYYYKVKQIYGFRYGYQGFIPSYNHEPIELTPDKVVNIHEMGGSFLGSSRGNQSVPEMVDTLERLGIDILFTIGGDGTMRAASQISKEVLKRNLPTSVIGIPKTIDNDLNLIERSFGYETAFSVASDFIRNSHIEARSVPNGIGLVKLMGRESGFIAINAALANREVNFCLIPEVDFNLDTEYGLLNELRKRLELRKHAVIVVAEGSGQKFFDDGVLKVDASNNPKLNDIGLFLKEKIETYFKSINMNVFMRYFDPSYYIRSVSATPDDRVYCGMLAQMAVHAAMAGKTGIVIGEVHGTFVHIPMEIVCSARKKVDPNGNLWLSVLESTGQGNLI